jgi:hypothetical protein
MELMLNIPEGVGKALQQKAEAEGKSFAEAALDALEVGLQSAAAPPKKMRDLSDLAGTWVEDPEFDKFMAEQDQVHPDEDWR